MINSIRIKLTLWYVGVLAVIIIAFAGLTYFLAVRVLEQEKDETLKEMALNFTAEIQAEYAEEAEKSLANDLSAEKGITEAIDESRFHDYIFAVYTPDSKLVSSTSSEDILNTRIADLVTSELSFTNLKIGRDEFRLRRQPFVLGNQNYTLMVAHSMKDQEKFLSRLRSILFLAVPSVLILTGLGGYFLARKSLAPVTQMSRQAATISSRNLNERLPVKNEKDELGNLAQILNALLYRLESSFEQQRRFMADASHELRTPLAIVRGESEVALAKGDRPAGELRESLAIVHDESKRLTKIVEDLFTLARADAGQFKVNLGKIYLDELLADCVRSVQVLAKKENIHLELTTLEEMPISGDEQLLRRLFINLLDNAIKYNHPNGKVSVSAGKDNAGYKIFIADTGAGISVEDKVKIFERFYRADKARSRTEETMTSGAGLGLAIAQWIAGLHEGSIEIVSSNEKGSVFAVVLPVRN